MVLCCDQTALPPTLFTTILVTIDFAYPKAMLFGFELSVFIFFIPSYEFYFLFLSATCNVLLISYLQSTDCSVADTVADTVADVYLQFLRRETTVST